MVLLTAARWEESKAERFLALLEAGFDAGEIADAVVPKSATERDAVWKIRQGDAVDGFLGSGVWALFLILVGFGCLGYNM